MTILECIEKIIIYSKDFRSGSELYAANEQLNYNAVIKLISVIGEEISKVSKVDTELLSSDDIDWFAIKSTRNRIVHDYRGIDQDIIFSIIVDELPRLRETLVLYTNMIDIPADLNESIRKSEYYKHIRHLFD